MKHLIKELLREGLLSEITDETYQLLQTKYNNSRVIISNEEKIIFRNNPIEEGTMTNWLTAGALILGALTNSSLAQTYKNSDEKTKINILDKIKSGAESGNEKLNILYNKIKKEAETTNQNTTTNNDFSKEDFELEAKKLGGVVGIGKSMDLAVSRKMALSDARGKLGNGIQKNGNIVDEQVIKDSNEQYITYIIYKI
jgi:hypothetical protein